MAIWKFAMQNRRFFGRGRCRALRPTATPQRYSKEEESAGQMEPHVTPELEAKLTHAAAQQGRNPDELAREVLTRYFEEESRFVEAVKRGEDALDRGDYLSHEQVAKRLQRFLQP
jgi:predicted transcriptional regulator